MNKTDKEQDKQDITLIITGVCSLVFAAVILVILVVSSAHMGGFLLAMIAFLSLVGVVSLLLGWQSYHARRKWKAEREENQRKEMQEQEERNQLARSGLWEFPVEAFYIECRDNHVTRINNEYSKQKALKIAKSIIEWQRIDTDCCTEYLKINRLREYLEAGRLAVEKGEKKKLSDSKIPKDATPDAEEGAFMERAKELSGLFGCQKREKMLSSMIESYKARIEAIRQGEEAMKQLGMIYASMQKKENDWAIRGGIAEGIAGPAAGLAVALNTMQSNEEIRAYNASMRKMSMDIMSGLPNMMDDKEKLRQELHYIYEQHSEMAYKVTLPNPTSDSIHNNIVVGKASVSKSKSGVLHIALPIFFKKAFVVDVPDDVHTVVDGTIKGEVWFEDSFVDEVIFPLPLYGIPSNMTEEVTLDGMCGRSVEYDGKYTIKIADTQNLWVMEA